MRKPRSITTGNGSSFPASRSNAIQVLKDEIIREVVKLISAVHSEPSHSVKGSHSFIAGSPDSNLNVSGDQAHRYGDISIHDCTDVSVSGP